MGSDNLLQVFEDGRSIDNEDYTIDLKNTVIILTSNFEAKHLISGLKGNVDERDGRCEIALSCGVCISLENGISLEVNDVAYNYVLK